MFRTANRSGIAAVSSIRRLSSKANSSSGRTIVRDPRKKKAIKPTVAVQVPETSESLQTPLKPTNENLPFAPSDQNQQSVGSTLGTYALAGVGMTLGFTLVRVLFGI